MTSSRPYLLRAMYQWLIDNELTPYAMVDAEYEFVEVPQQFIEDGKIVLNIAPQAVLDFEITNQAMLFDASFSGVVNKIYVPIKAVMAIYAFENGRGMMFGDDEEDGDDTPPEPPPKRGKPNLKIVK